MKKRNSNSNLIAIISIIAIVIIVAITFFVLNKGETITTENSTGGVIICGMDYPCGMPDGVCPASYGADCNGNDIDCEV
ncbi:MAG: hypothetical protein PHE43_00350 [Candidatus Nanoarchaeia archaeon]|nr:hypothetical protein [Candidatus Nanoarchaeia archaeon]